MNALTFFRHSLSWWYFSSIALTMPLVHSISSCRPEDSMTRNPSSCNAHSSGAVVASIVITTEEGDGPLLSNFSDATVSSG